MVVGALALALGVTTRVEQDRQIESVRALYEADAALIGLLVRESAQQAARATDLVYSMTAGGLLDVADLLGPAPADGDCEAALARVPGLRVWVTRDASGLRGCFGPVPEARRRALIDEVASADDPGFVDQGLARELGLFCSSPSRSPGTIVCRARAGLDRLRREVGLGPLLSGLKGAALLYVVLQDATGLLASSPHPGILSAWHDDPALAAALEPPAGRLSSRLLASGPERGPVFETLGSLELGDGSRAVVRIGQDASQLAELRARIELRHLVMVAVLAAAVALSLALAWVLARAQRRRREHLAELQRREDDHRHWQALGQLAATVAHEVRNPLNAIGMALQRLRNEFQVAEAERGEFAELVQVAVDSADRVERVVSEFLDLGRPLVLERQPHDPRELVRQVLAPFVLRARGEQKSLVSTVTGEGDVVVDRRRFGQVLANLVANALEAVPSGGTVRVEASVDERTFTVGVVDDGPGMDEAAVARAVTPFVTSKATGTGLGLPLARRLAEAHGGSLELASTPGRGTTATVRLPRLGGA